MNVAVALLLVAAVILVAVHAIGTTSRVHLGWLGIACVIAAYAVPALTAL